MSACTHTFETKDEERYTLDRYGLRPFAYLESLAGSARTSGSRTASTLQTRSSTFAETKRAWRTAPFPT
ncbi:MAG: hypothetical protein ACLTG4_12100 [Oscillospiraceae bacterium]